MSFRWQTDEDPDEPITPPPALAPPHRLSRRILTLLALFAVLATLVFLSWRSVRQRAIDAEERLQADVLSLHNLALNAVESGDGELYLTLLPPDQPRWKETQQQLLQNDLLFAGAARFYDLAPHAGAAPTPQVALDPTLTQATVTTQQSFAVSGTTSAPQSVTLRQIQALSLGATGWRLAPPPPAYWRPEIIVPGSSFTLRYPRRDEAVALRLHAQLERLLPQTCALPGLECPPEMHLTVRLVSDPDVLASGAQPEAFLHNNAWRGSGQIDLPAPSLVGQPVDESGEAFVARAYAARVLAPLISHLAGYDCCPRSLLARAIIERQLVHLGLRDWPLTPDHYEALMSQGLTLGNALILQARDIAFMGSDAWLQALSLVEFLEQSLPPGQLLSTMETSLDAWLLRADEPGSFVIEWTEAMYARSRSAQRAADLDPPPQGVLQLTCFGSEAVAVQRYELQGAGWQHGITYAASDGWQIEAVFPLPADYGEILKVARRDPQGNRAAGFVWVHRGGSSTLFETAPTDDSSSLFAPYDGAAPHWRYTVVSPHLPALRAAVEQEWWQMKLPQCDEGVCRDEIWKARPHWSPSGERLLLEAQAAGGNASLEEHTLFRAGSRGQNAVQIAGGFAPSWLDDTHYAYLRPARAQSGEEVVIASTGDDLPVPIVAAADFVQLLESGLPGGSALTLVRLQPVPNANYLMLLHAVRPSTGVAVDIEPDSFLFTIRLTPELSRLAEIALLFHSDGALDFRPSPDGRWVAVRGANAWSLVNVQTGDSRPLGAVGAPAWSPDGAWLAQSRDYHIMLHAPGLEYRRPIVHQLGDCPFSSLQWLSR